MISDIFILHHFWQKSNLECFYDISDNGCSKNIGIIVGVAFDRQMQSVFYKHCYPLLFLQYIHMLLLNLETTFPYIVDIPFNRIPLSPII